MSLSITPNASAALKEALDRNGGEGEEYYRLVQDSDGNISLSLDQQQEQDQLLSHEGETVLLVDPPVAEALSGLTLDVDLQKGHFILYQTPSTTGA